MLPCPLSSYSLNIQITVVSIGPKQAIEQIRHGLALGADKGILIETDTRLDKDLYPLTVAKILKDIVDEVCFYNRIAIWTQEKPQLVLMGKQSIDTDNGQTGMSLQHEPLN